MFFLCVFLKLQKRRKKKKRKEQRFFRSRGGQAANPGGLGAGGGGGGRGASNLRCRLSLSGQSCPNTLSATPLDTGHSARPHHPCDRAAGVSPKAPSNSPKWVASSVPASTTTPVARGSDGGGIVQEVGAGGQEEELEEGASSSQPRQTVIPSSGDSSRAATGDREEARGVDGGGLGLPPSFVVGAAVAVPAARSSTSLLGAQARPLELVLSLARNPARSCVPLVA